jgi:hypothetical protein
MLIVFLVIVAGILVALWIPRRFLRILGVGAAIVMAVIAFNAVLPGFFVGFLVPIVIVATVVYALATSRRRS